MTQEHVSILLCVLGCTYLASAWIGRRTGDAARDVRLTLGTGSLLVALGGGMLIA
jgi:hypothetical protein